MWNDYSAFTSYRPTTGKHVTLANNTKAPVLGIGSIKILLDGKVCGIRNVLHVPSLRAPLYSLWAHRLMPGCGFIGDNSKFHVYFPSFVTSVDDTVDSYIAYEPLGRSSSLLEYDYLQPRIVHARGVTAPPSLPTRSPTVIECTPSKIDPMPCATDIPASDVDTSQYDINFPPLPPAPSTLLSSPLTTPAAGPAPCSMARQSLPKVTTPTQISATTLQSFLPTGANAPAPVRPCDTPNGSDTTCHLTADLIYRLFG